MSCLRSKYFWSWTISLDREKHPTQWNCRQTLKPNFKKCSCGFYLGYLSWDGVIWLQLVLLALSDTDPLVAMFPPTALKLWDPWHHYKYHQNAICSESRKFNSLSIKDRRRILRVFELWICRSRIDIIVTVARDTEWNLFIYHSP